MTVIDLERPPKLRRSQLNWLLTALPAFPLALLVLRLWYLSRQDMPTMLLLVQNVSPLGMVSALVVTLIWAVPAVVLVVRTLGGIMLVSSPDRAEAVRGSWLAATAVRMPDWVVWLAAGLAGFTWELRMLPALVMLLFAILGLTAVQRYPGHRALLTVTCLVMPVLAGLVELVWLWPGIRSAWSEDRTTALLLAAPPLLGWLLTGPVPPRAARLATHGPAVAAMAVAPLVVGFSFLQAPVLPNSAIETSASSASETSGNGASETSGNGAVGTSGDEGAPTRVIRGQIITVDDTATTVLQRGGDVLFIPNGEIMSKVLCPQTIRSARSRITVRGWAVDESALEWAAPTKPATAEVDPRCLGRPLVVK